jgi:hypothetical protein
MEVLTKKQVIKDVPKRWKNQYPNGKEHIYEKLIAAKPLSKKKVDAIIGNDSWTTLTCDQCSKDVPLVVLLDNSEYSNSICEQCLNKALDLINEPKI